jgi:hypothetical protein
VQHFFPGLQPWLKAVKDPRDPERIEYPAAFLLSTVILMFLTKLGARRQTKFQFGTRTMVSNINALAGTNAQTAAHPDTLEYLMKRISPDELGAIRPLMVRQLVRKRSLDQFRVEGRMMVAADGTGIVVYRTRHCDHCLTQKHGAVTIYYHLVLEAKLVTGNGMAFSMETEFIENPGVDPEKQDCETKAFMRLAPRLKASFPQMMICMLLDGLYLQEPVMRLCRESGWAFVTTFKEGSAPAVWADFRALLELSPENRLARTSRGVGQEFRWVNDLPFGKETVSAIECVETAPDGTVTRYAWATSMHVDRHNVVAIANDAGRLRWKIENEGFNEQKNSGYNLEHAYSENERAAKNYYILLQIAHAIEMLIQKGNLLVRMVGRTIRDIAGGVRAFGQYLRESLRNHVIDAGAVERTLGRRIQIRLGWT